MKIYVVQPNDTVDSISRQQNAGLASLIEVNQLTPPYRLAVGQALLLTGNDSPDILPPDRPGAVLRSGYAYPFISAQLL